MNEITEIKATPLVQAGGAIAAQSPMGMMLAAVQQGASLEQISQMMDLQQRWEKSEAKKAYDAAFAAFKAEAVTIKRGKKVESGPLSGRSYAELHDVVNAVTPALSKHGLSSSWKLTKDDRDWIEVTCFLRHVGGHEESVSMGGPPDTGGAKNAIQARASAKTYLERYTLKAITGLSEEDDDLDGATPDALASYKAYAASAATIDDLNKIKKEGMAAYNKAKDVPGFAAFMKICQQREGELSNA